MRCSTILWQGKTEWLKRSNHGERIITRLMVPKIAVPTILDPKFTSFVRTEDDIDINTSCVVPTHDSLPFNVLQLNDVPFHRVEKLFIHLSKLMNCKDAFPNFKLDYRYDSDLTLRSKWLLPASLVRDLRKEDEAFQNFNADRMLYIDDLRLANEFAVHLNVPTQFQVSAHVKHHLLKYQKHKKTDLEFDQFDTIDEEVLVYSFRNVLSILKNKIAIEHHSGCSIEVPKYNENYAMDDLLQVYVKGVNRFNTVKGVRILNRHTT